MASLRARRPRGEAAPPPRRGRRQAPPPSYEGMPRLARIKLSGGIGGDDMQVTGKSLVVGVAGAVLFLGIAVAGATWLGSSLFDAREALAQSADSAAATAGFAIDRVDVERMPDAPPITEARAAEVRALIVPQGRQSILSLDPEEVKARVEGLDWVASVRVRRLWPSTLKVEVERRQEYALWEHNGEVSVVDVNGAPLASEHAEDHEDLPRLLGAGAGSAAQPLLVALEGLPNLRARLRQLVRINDRRWNLELASGAIVALPEEDAPEALVRLEALQAEYALLDRPIAALDMRARGRLAVRIHPELEGGPRPLLGGV